MINEQKIKIFLLAAENLSFTKTAADLFISQQAVSKYISQFEEELGYKLFIRSPHSVALTPQGERSSIFFRSLLKSTSEFIREERETQILQEKSLRIGYNNWLEFGEASVNANILFHKEYPSVPQIAERHPPDVLQAKLRDGQLDIIITIDGFLSNRADLDIVALKKVPMVIIVSKKLEGKSLPDRQNLSAMPLVVNAFANERPKETEARAKAQVADVGLNNDRIIITPNRDSVYTAVEMGEGIAIACADAHFTAGLGMIETGCFDTLICACLKSSKRRMVRFYIDMIYKAFHADA